MADESCILPPSPNWYCSSAADCSVSGIYAFAAKNHVFLLDTNTDPPVFREQFSKHSDRITAVVSCPHSPSSLCVSASEDKAVKLWDMKSKIIIASHDTHHAKITCLSWSSVESDLIFSADEKGSIIAWRQSKNVVYSTCPIQEYVFCIASAHSSEHLVSAGYKNGLIIVLKLHDDGLTVAHRLRGHDGDVHSLVWCPVSIDQLDIGPLQDKALNSKGNIVVSGSRDQTIRLWDALNGKLLNIFNLPKRSSQKWRDRHDWQSKERLWLALCWPKSLPNRFISSSHSGELLQWNLSVPSGSEQIQHFGQGHSRIVFNICCNEEGTKAISFSMDRLIIIWDLKTLHSLHTISTLGGFAYALDISPLDPGTIAIGVGDNMIRVWHSASTSSIYETVILWQGIKSKVQVVSWHPHNEGILGFGTESGQVGTYNTISKKAKAFATYHKTTVYSLSWGTPCPGNEDKDDSTLNLYSCSGDGSVLQHRPNHPLKDAINVNVLIQSTNGSKHKLMSCTEVSWNCNGTALAIGNHDGTIEVFVPPSLRRVCTIAIHKKSITYLAWHPGYGDDSTNGEGRLTYRLASGSNETTIHIHDLTSVLNGDGTTKDTPTSITSSHRKLVGHGGRVTSLCWSPHHCDLLVSASYDGSAQVWDVEANKTLANFRGHVGRLLSVQWSYLDANTVYSGGEDGSVRPWSIVGQKYTQPPTGGKTSKPKKKSKPKQKEAPIVEPSQNGQESRPDATQHTDSLTRHQDLGEDIDVKTVCPNLEEDVGLQAQPEPTLSWRTPTRFPGSSQSEGLVAAHAQSIEEIQKNNSVSMVIVDNEDAASVSSISTQELGPTVIVSKSKGEAAKKKKKKSKSMFPLSAVADSNPRPLVQQDCVTLAQLLYQAQPGDAMATAVQSESFVPGEAASVNLGFFADRSSAYRMIDAEGRHHASANNLDYKLQLEVWKGNLGEALRTAIEAKQLSDWLVAMSALAGREVWLHTAESYAMQLESEGAFSRAVLYHLACHQVYKAIDVFKQQSMFREAIALAKVRLSPSDPVLHDLYCSWARKLETEHYENSAKCYLAAGLPAEAVRVLSTRGDLPSLNTALKVSIASEQHQLSTSLVIRVVHVCMGTGNWCAAEEALASCTGVRGYLIALLTHEILVDELLREGVVSDKELKELCHSDTFRQTDQGEWHSVIDDSMTFSSQDESPWLLDPQPRDWVVSRILKAWDRAGLLRPQDPCFQSAIQQLSSYSQSNMNENLSVNQMLTRISYDVAHGLLCGVHQRNYTCSLPWLQTLESCVKNNYFSLAQFLCVQLLPRGTQSMEAISVLRRELHTKCEAIDGVVTEEQEFTTEVLFAYFSSFYNLVVLYKIWRQDSKVLALCSGGQESSIEESVDNLSREISTPQNMLVIKVADRIAAEIAENSAEKVQGDQGVPSSEIVPGADEARENHKQPTAVNSFPSDDTSENRGLVRQGIYSILCSLVRSLLRRDLVVCAALKKQLLEATKQVILLRSRRILDSVAAASTSKQKRTSKKKTKGSQSSKENSGEVELSENAPQINSSGNDGGDLTEASYDAPTPEEGSPGVSRVPLSSTSLDLDVRYTLGVWSLELMQQEEQRLVEELSKHPLKELPFPDTTESAMMIGHVCSKAITYPCHEPAMLYKLGLEVVTSALEHAQWTMEKDILRQLENRLVKLNT